MLQLRVASWHGRPPEPKATGSNPVGRAIRLRWRSDLFAPFPASYGEMAHPEPRRSKARPNARPAALRRRVGRAISEWRGPPWPAEAAQGEHQAAALRRRLHPARLGRSRGPNAPLRSLAIPHPNHAELSRYAGLSRVRPARAVGAQDRSGERAAAAAPGEPKSVTPEAESPKPKAVLA